MWKLCGHYFNWNNAFKSLYIYLLILLNSREKNMPKLKAPAAVDKVIPAFQKNCKKYAMDEVVYYSISREFMNAISSLSRELLKKASISISLFIGSLGLLIRFVPK